jgi:hypothetical protein
MGGACSTYGVRITAYRFWSGVLWKGGHLEYPDVDRRIYENGSSGSGKWGIDWIDLAQDRDRW